MFTSILWKGGVIGFAAACCIGLVVAHEHSHGPKSLPVTGDTLLAYSRVPLQARSILQRACQDCHSDNTEWPWYSKIPPVSWQIHDDVSRGRTAMNLSKWSEYNDRQRTGFLLALLAVAKAGAMPPREYVWMHPDARLSNADLKVLEQWAISEARVRAHHGPGGSP